MPGTARTERAGRRRTSPRSWSGLRSGRSAGGGVAATAAFLRRASELTPDPVKRAVRALAAAQATLAAGDFATAVRLLLTADEGPVEALHQARVNLVRAQIALFAGHPVEAPQLLAEAAHRLEPLDLDLARDTYLNALQAAQLAGRLAGSTGLVEVARAARALPTPDLGRKRDLALDGTAALFTDGHPAAVAPATDAVRAFARAQGPPDADDMRWLGHGATLTVHLWDHENWDVLTRRNLQIARELGQLTELPYALSLRVFFHLFAGEISAAAAMVAEIQTITDATGAVLAPYGEVCLAAWRGHPETAAALITSSKEEAGTRGEGLGVTVAHFANAVLLNSLTKYREALMSAQNATAYPVELGAASWALPELIEAAARSDRPDLAADALDRLSLIAQSCATDWALGVLARSKALITNDRRAAEAAYQEAIQHSAGHACGWNSPGPAWCTANGSVGTAGVSRPADNCRRRTRCSRPLVPTPSPTGRATNWWQPERRSCSALPTPGTH